MKSRDHHTGDAAGRAGAAIRCSPGCWTARSRGGRVPRANASLCHSSIARTCRAFGLGSFFVNSPCLDYRLPAVRRACTDARFRVYQLAASPEGGGRAHTNFLRLKPASDAAQDFAKGLKTSVWLACRHDRQPRRMNAPVRAQVVPIGGKSHAGRS